VYLAEGVNVFAVNPGWVWTSNRLSMIETFGFYPFLIVYPIVRLLKIGFAKKPKTAARTVIYCAVEPLLEHWSDLYFE
jgi:NAD(P)-dependent dehydrogenase (short-subunit alcohol dehydrogenase family)